jgi:hypothetical protein
MSSPRRLPAPVEPGLPADPNAFLDPNEEPVPPEVLNGPVPGQDSRFYNDMYNDSGNAPQEVVDDVLPEVRRAEPAPREATASMMDTSFINKINDPNLTDEQARAEYDKLPPALRYVYDRVADFSYNNPDTQTPAQLDPRDANRWLDEFYQMQQKSPQNKLAETRLSAIEQGTKEDAQKTYQRADNMIFLLDNLRGGPRDKVPKEREKWRSRVGSVQGRWPTMLSSEETLGWNADFGSLKGVINLTEAQANKGQGQLSDGERVLMAQAASLGLEQARDEPGFEKAFERMYDMALEARDASMSKLSGGKEAPSAPAAPQSGSAPQASPAAAPAAAPGFQPGKIYRDGQGRPARFRGYDAQGKPTFDKI